MIGLPRERRWSLDNVGHGSRLSECGSRLTGLETLPQSQLRLTAHLTKLTVASCPNRDQAVISAPGPTMWYAAISSKINPSAAAGAEFERPLFWHDHAPKRARLGPEAGRGLLVGDPSSHLIIIRNAPGHLPPSFLRSKPSIPDIVHNCSFGVRSNGRNP